MLDPGLSCADEERSEDEEDQRRIFCLPCSSRASDLLCASLLVCMFTSMCVCVCVCARVHTPMVGEQGWRREYILLLKRHFDWHKPSVVLFCIRLLVYLPKPQTMSGGRDIKGGKCKSTEPAASQHNWQPQSHKWAHIDSFQGVN